MSQDGMNRLEAARELIGAGRLHEAAALLGVHLHHHPHDERAWHMLSLALPDPEKQAYALRRVLQLNPDNRAARAQLNRLTQPPARFRPPAPSTAPVSVGPRPASIQRPAAAVARPAPARPAPAGRQASGREAGPASVPREPSTLARMARYVVVRVIVLFVTVAVGLFLAVVFVNYGGYIDEMFEARIEEAVAGMARGMTDVPPEEIPPILEEARQAMFEAYGLNDPFLLRCFRWFLRGITLNWGDAERMQSLAGRESRVQAIIMERLPYSLLLAGVGNIFLFVASLLLALSLSKKYGSLLDKLIVAFSPLSAAPTWVHGILLTVVFAAELGWLPFSGLFDEAPPAVPLGYVLVLAKHMILPVLAIFMATFFQSVYAWRTFFVLHSREDYVEVAEAKGLPARMLERRYILRPTLPYIITSFAMMLVTFWQGLLILEVFFHWPGIGALFIDAIKFNDRPVLVSLIVMFAYLLALTVFILDVVYALVDPRVRIGSNGRQAARPRHAVRARRFGRRGPAVAVKPMRQPSPERAPAVGRRLTSLPGDWLRGARRLPRVAGSALREMVRYPSAIVGLLLIAGLLGMALYAVAAVPISEAIRVTRGSAENWYEAPKYARPVWVNLFRKRDLPPSIVMDSAAGTAAKVAEAVSDDMTRISMSFPFDYPYGELPQDIIVFVRAQYEAKRPHLIFSWHTPDGRDVEISNFSLPSSADTYYLADDERLARRLDGRPPLEALFLAPGGSATEPLQGRYEFRIDAFVFEDQADVDARFVLDGQVYGLAGTDNMRRDLLVPLLWGTPVALVFGVLGAVGTSLVTMVIAGVGTWFGGLLDGLVQRLTEVNMILPALPIAIMVYEVYSKSIWVILGVMVLLNILGSALKSYRAIFLQVKEAPYVEAAQVYGANNRRIILRYLVPRIMPVLVPQLVILIPGYVFLEATLAYLGVVDPILPTWGKLVYNALTGGAFQGHYHWFLEPIGLLLVTGLAFALLGFALDRILNPRLRTL